MPKKIIMTPIDQKHSSSVDYLKELRSQRSTNSNAQTRPKCNYYILILNLDDWKTDLNKK